MGHVTNFPLIPLDFSAPQTLYLNNKSQAQALLSSLPPRKAQNVVKIPLFHYINVRRIQIKELSQRNLLPYGERKPIAAFSSGLYRQGWRCNWRVTRFEQQVRNAASSVCKSHSDSHQVVHSRTARSFHFLPICLVGAVCKCRFAISHLVREIYIKIYTYAFLKKEKKKKKTSKSMYFNAMNAPTTGYIH